MTTYDAIAIALACLLFSGFFLGYVYRNHDHGFNPNGDDRHD